MGPAKPADPAEFEDFVATLYLAMVRVGNSTLERLLEEGYLEADVRRGAKALANRGLVTAIGPDAWDVHPPETSLPRLAATLEARARFTRASAAELGVMWRQARGTGEPGLGGVEAIGSVTGIVHAMQAARVQAREQFCMLLDDSPATRTFLLGLREEEAADRPKTLVCVVDLELLQDTEVVSALERLAGSGAAVSVVPHVPFGATVADDALAVVDLSHYGSEGAASFLVRRSPVVMALAALVAAANRLATPLRPLGRGGNRPTVPLSQRDQRILALLATGATDQVIARHLGVSIRTVERRVRALMDTLGAATRFQAGVLAGRRGWI